MCLQSWLLNIATNEFVNDFRFFLLDPDESNTKLQFLYNNEDLRVNVFEMLMYIIDEHDFEYKKYQNKEIVELQTDTSTYEIISEVTSNGLLTNTALINKKYPNLNVLNTNKIFNENWTEGNYFEFTVACKCDLYYNFIEL